MATAHFKNDSNICSFANHINMRVLRALLSINLQYKLKCGYVFNQIFIYNNFFMFHYADFHFFLVVNLNYVSLVNILLICNYSFKMLNYI